MRQNGAKAYIIEPQTIFVPTISGVLLDAHLEIAAILQSFDARALLEGNPDVVFVDLDFLEGDPLAIIGLLRTLLPDALILIYTARFDEQTLPEYSARGANGVLSKSMSREELTSSIKTLISGSVRRLSLSPSAAESLPKDSRYRRPDERT